MLTNVDSDGRSFAESLKPGKKSQALKPIKITAGDIQLDRFTITEVDAENTRPDTAYEVYYKP